MEWLTTCFLRIEMHYLGPWNNGLSTWIVASSLYGLYTRITIRMGLWIVDMYDFVGPPLGSHEDMNSMHYKKIHFRDDTSLSP